MLDASLKEQLKELFGSLEADYLFDIAVRADHGSARSCSNCSATRLPHPTASPAA